MAAANQRVRSGGAPVMRLAARLARKNCITGDEDPNNVEMFVPEAAASLAAAEVAAALRISPVTAGIRVREAETMTTELAPTLDLLHNGTLDRGKGESLPSTVRR